uniref:Uncharacterized protein n=1 Tax=Caenorhabditis japonica TaxID=281687 RepID=A0A8R1ERH0_CAEJA
QEMAAFENMRRQNLLDNHLGGGDIDEEMPDGAA